MTFVILNEATLFPALLSGLLKRPMLLIDVKPSLPRLGAWLRKVAALLIRRGFLVDVADKWPEYRPFRETTPMSNLSDLYIRIEGDMDSYLEGRVNLQRGQPATPIIRHAFWVMVESLGNSALLIAFLARDGRLGQTPPLGANRLVMSMSESYLRKSLPHRPEVPVLSQLVSLCIVASVWVVGCIWLLRRIRTQPTAPTDYFLGCTFMADPRVYYLLEQVAPAPETVCIYLHHPEQKEFVRKMNPAFRTCSLKEGFVHPLELFGAFAEMAGELWRFFDLLGAQGPYFFLPIAKHAFLRQKYRALFRRYRFQWFWGKDDYETGHITRNQELRTLGGRAVGHMHGFPVNNLLEPLWRHLDFDLYFLFCRALYETWYKPHWPDTMKVVVAGPYGMTRPMLARLSAPRPKDILFFFVPSLRDDLLCDAVLSAAKAFPDRKIFIKIKPNRLREGYFTDFPHICAKFPNILFTQEDSYELMLKARYSVGAISTTVQESLFYGCVTFALDVQPPDYPFHYREFPGLCVGSGAALVARIRDLESGNEIYDRSLYMDLVDIDGGNVFDIVKCNLDHLSPGAEMPAFPCVSK